MQKYGTSKNSHSIAQRTHFGKLTGIYRQQPELLYTGVTLLETGLVATWTQQECSLNQATKSFIKPHLKSFDIAPQDPIEFWPSITKVFKEPRKLLKNNTFAED